MAGVFDWARLLTGDRDNPEEDIGQWSDENQKRNRAALGLDANGNPVPAAPAAPAAPGAPTALPGANPAADGSSPGAQAAVQAQASSTLPPNQESNATKTPVSLGHLMMNLQQYNEREQGFNQALGQGFAAFAQPRDRDMVSKMFNVTPADPTKIAATQQNLGMNQQGQDRMNALGQMIHGPQGDGIAQRLNISKDELIARYQADPAGVGNMIQSFASPTDQMKNIQQINTYVDQVHQRDSSKSPEVLTMIKNAMMSGMAGPQAEAAIGDAVAYKQRTGKDAPWVVNGNIDQRAYAQFGANEKAKEDDRGNAAKVLAENQNTAEELRSNLEQLKEMPGLKSILADPVKRAAATKALNPSVDLPSLVAQNILTDEEAAAVATLRKIGGASTETAMRSMAGTGTRVTQQEVGPLKDSISSAMNLNQDYDTYTHNAINPFITKIKKTVANSYGASGNLAHMDPEYEPWLHPIYRKDGELFKEGSGAEKIPDLQPLTPGKLTWLKGEVSNYPAGRDDALDSLQQEGFDVSKYRRSNPKDW